MSFGTIFCFLSFIDSLLYIQQNKDQISKVYSNATLTLSKIVVNDGDTNDLVSLALSLKKLVFTRISG